MQFIELYNLGVTDLDELEEKLESPKVQYIHIFIELTKKEKL